MTVKATGFSPWKKRQRKAPSLLPPSRRILNGAKPLTRELDRIDSIMIGEFPPAIEELRRYHTERREQAVTVTCEKSPVPMLWLDTSVLIDLAKIENGENIDAIRAAALTELRNKIEQLGVRQKLICPEWDQSTEFEGKRLEKEINEISARIALGAHCVPYQGVKDEQMRLGTTEYRANSGRIDIPWAVHFYGDPRSRVAETISQGFVIVSELEKPEEWIQKSDRDRDATHAAWEGLRQEFIAEGRTFEDQVRHEKVGEAYSMIKMLAVYHRKTQSAELDMWDKLSVEGFLKWMASWGSTPEESIAALFAYMHSPYYGELPIVDVACRLSADLVVRPPGVKRGDSMDVQHLATAIPLSHYVLADKAMTDRCGRLGLGAKYRTKIYSSKAIDGLLAELELL
jgi:hypothetical protein